MVTHIGYSSRFPVFDQGGTHDGCMSSWYSRASSRVGSRYLPTEATRSRGAWAVWVRDARRTPNMCATESNTEVGRAEGEATTTSKSPTPAPAAVTTSTDSPGRAGSEADSCSGSRPPAEEESRDRLLTPCDPGVDPAGRRAEEGGDNEVDTTGRADEGGEIAVDPAGRRADEGGDAASGPPEGTVGTVSYRRKVAWAVVDRSERAPSKLTLRSGTAGDPGRAGGTMLGDRAVGAVGKDGAVGSARARDTRAVRPGSCIVSVCVWSESYSISASLHVSQVANRVHAAFIVRGSCV